MFLPRKHFFRIRSVILHSFIFSLGFLTCFVYINYVIPAFPENAPQVVLEDDYYGSKSFSSSSSNTNIESPVTIARKQGKRTGTTGESEPSTSIADSLPIIPHSASFSSTNAQNYNKVVNNIYYEEVTLVNNDLNTSNNNIGNRFSTNGPGTVWVVTPTFYRPEQKPELTRVAQALLPASHFIHWLVVDDISQGSEESLRDLQAFLQRFPLNTTLLKSIPRSQHMKIVGRPRGVNGRRAAIAWLRENAQGGGVVYFADDDNTYDSDIFRQMQYTKKVSMWPVGLVTELGVSSPIVKNGKVVGFYDGWNGLRKFPVDMAGFAINMELFHQNRRANMPWVAGYEEDELLRSLGIKTSDIIPLARNCTEILVWHTKALRNGWPKRPKSLKTQTVISTNLKQLLQNLPQKHLAGANSSTKNDVTKETEKFSLFNLFFGS